MLNDCGRGLWASIKWVLHYLLIHLINMFKSKIILYNCCFIYNIAKDILPRWDWWYSYMRDTQYEIDPLCLEVFGWYCFLRTLKYWTRLRWSMPGLGRMASHFCIVFLVKPPIREKHGIRHGQGGRNPCWYF